MSKSRNEMLLEAVINGETPNFEPQSRIERYLASLCGKSLGGGVSSWNEITDKPFGVKRGEPVEILPETAITIIDGQPGVQTDIVLEIGKTYSMAVNGVAYESVAIDGASIGQNGLVVWGNVDAMMGTGDNGIPLVVMNVPGFGFMVASEIIDLTNATLAIFEIPETVKKLDEKYLPEISFIDLVALGMPAVAIGTTEETVNGVEELRKLMQKGTFRYKALFAVSEGINIDVIATVNSFVSYATGSYQATCTVRFQQTNLLLNLVVDDNISLGVYPLTA